VKATLQATDNPCDLVGNQGIVLNENPLNLQSGFAQG
jgi:hypothetical protein